MNAPNCYSVYAYEKFVSPFGNETNTLLEKVEAKASALASCEYDSDFGVCKLHLGFNPGRDFKDSSFGLLVQHTLTAEAEITAEDYNDSQTCATIIVKATAKYHAGWDVGIGPGSFRSQVTKLIEEKLITRVSCVCGDCPVLPP